MMSSELSQINGVTAVDFAIETEGAEHWKIRPASVLVRVTDLIEKR